MRRGKYVCLEGGDGTGKSTLAAALCNRLTDSRAEQKRFPSDGCVGRVIRGGLMGQLLLSEKSYLYLFAADGLQEEEEIQQILSEGVHIICDRHPTLSGRAFQPIHHSEEQIEAVYGAACVDGISMPDFLFVLEVPYQEAIRRMQSREKYKDVVFEQESAEYINKIADRYTLIAERFGGHVIDATRPVDELVELVMRIAGLE